MHSLPSLVAGRQLYRALGIPGWNWLATALGCLLVLVTVAGERPGGRAGSLDSSARRFLSRDISSDQDAITYYTAAQHSGRNSWAAPILGWTNNPRSLSSIGSFSGWHTNF